MDISQKTVDIYAPLRSGQSQDQSAVNTPDIQAFVLSQLTQSADPASAYASRIQSRHILLENPVKESRIKRERDEKKRRRKDQKERKRRKGGALGREAAMFSLEPAQTKFDLFVPLHQLWLGYMSEMLSLSEAGKSIPMSASMHPRLVKADFHGSIITVRRSKNTSQTNLSGIVLHETENAFRVITRDDKLKLLPKQNTVFAFSVPAYAFTPDSPHSSEADRSTTSRPSKITVHDIPHLEFELYGNQFMFRSTDRVSRKFKAKETIEI